MVDRQDIDALLIGSLYGELSSAEQARLQLHLDSHPTDRTVLDNLTRARSAVRESRIFAVQLEPPQAVSALLLQEAARRARPANNESWFQRFLRSFVGHPAMAAATMLVLVLGVAGTVYLRRGHEHLSTGTVKQAPVEPSLAQETTPATGAMKPPAAPVVPAGADRDDEQGSAHYSVTLADDDKPADPAPSAPSLKRKAVATGKKAAPETEKELAKAEESKPVQRRTGPSRPLEVSTPEHAPKDLDEAPASQAPANAAVGGGAAPAPNDSYASPEGKLGATRGGDAVTKGRSVPAPPPPPPPPGAEDRAREKLDVAKDKTPPAKVAADKPAMPKPATLPPDTATSTELAWARDQHARVVTQVSRGNCTDAARLALTLSNRAPGYYEANVQNDRQVRECLAYINAERDREAERTRLRASKRKAIEEPKKAAPPAATTDQATEKQR